MNRTIIYVTLLICAAVFSALGVSVVARSGNELIIDPSSAISWTEIEADFGEAAFVYGAIDGFDFSINDEFLQYTQRYNRCKFSGMETAIAVKKVILYFSEIGVPDFESISFAPSAFADLQFVFKESIQEILDGISRNSMRIARKDPNLDVSIRLSKIEQSEIDALAANSISSKVILLTCDGHQYVNAPNGYLIRLTLRQAITENTIKSFTSHIQNTLP